MPLYPFVWIDGDLSVRDQKVRFFGIFLKLWSKEEEKQEKEEGF